MRTRLCVPLMLLSVIGCKTPAATTDAPPAAVEQAEQAEQQPHWLVWHVSATGAHSTDLVDATGVVASAPGIWVGAGERLWRYNAITLDVERPDCDCEMQAMRENTDDAECRTSVGVDLGELAAHGVTPLLAPPADFLGEGVESSSVEVVGTVGPYAFVSACVSSYVCGAAHGGVVCTQAIWDLRSSAEINVYDLAPDRLRGEEVVTFMYDAHDDEHSAAETQVEDVALVALRPLFEGSYQPRLEEQYTAATCYACSDGQWDSYTVSARRTVDVLPAMLEKWLGENAPPPGTSAGTMRGWSVMPATDAAAEEFRAAAR